MDSSDLKSGLAVAAIIGSGIFALAGIVYLIVSVAKFAWGS